MTHETLVFTQLPGGSFLFGSIRRHHTQSIIFVIFHLRAIRVIIFHIHAVLFCVNKGLSPLLRHIILIYHIWFRIQGCHFATLSFVSCTCENAIAWRVVAVVGGVVGGLQELHGLNALSVEDDVAVDLEL